MTTWPVGINTENGCPELPAELPVSINTRNGCPELLLPELLLNFFLSFWPATGRLGREARDLYNRVKKPFAAGKSGLSIGCNMGRRCRAESRQQVLSVAAVKLEKYGGVELRHY